MFVVAQTACEKTTAGASGERKPLDGLIPADEIHVHITAEKDKIQEDKQVALEKVHGLRNEFKENGTTTTKQTKDDAGQCVQPSP